MAHNALYIGLMSGTSVDAIDAALVDFSSSKPDLVCSLSLPWGDLQEEIHSLCSPGENEIPRMAKLDSKVGEFFADAALQLLAKASISAEDVIAIGSHGQTIRHLPPTSVEKGFSLQVGDPNIIAELTGITTVTDFRRRDIAAGGHGAPLVPAFHQNVFEEPGVSRVIVNIGGIANVTYLPGNGQISGYDTGPGNTLLDAWCQKHKQKPYDEGGKWAAQGEINNALLKAMLSCPYFSAQAPKSTGRELFNLHWLQAHLPEAIAISPADIQATLLELTAQSIVLEINRLNPMQVYICGGGAFNEHLMQRLAALLSPMALNTTQALGVEPEWIEAMAFAWLAKQTLSALPGNAPQATGAHGPVILGGIYQK